MQLLDRTKVKVLMALQHIETYQDLAIKTGLHYNTVYTMMGGKSVRIETIMQLARGLGVATFDVLTDETIKALVEKPDSGAGS